MENQFLCDVCGQGYRSRGSLTRHVAAIHTGTLHECPHRCGYVANRDYNLARHIRTVHRVQPLPPMQEGEGDPGPAYHSCEHCGRRFRRAATLRRHVQAAHLGLMRYQCDRCGANFRRGDVLARHVQEIHGRDPLFACAFCDRPFRRQFTKDWHERYACPVVRDLVLGRLPEVPQSGPSAEPQPGPSTEPQPGPSREPQPGPSREPVQEGAGAPRRPSFSLVERAFRGRLETFRLTRPMDALVTIEEAMVLLFEDLSDLLEEALHRHGSVKVNLFLECEFVNVHGETCVRAFKTKNVALTEASDLEEFVSSAFAKLVREKEQCEHTGSGWSYLRVRDLEVRINRYVPLGERGRSHIQLPQAIADTHAVVNVTNDDDVCFMYAVLSKFVPMDPQRPEAYTLDIISRYDWADLRFPVAIKDIGAFERSNNISINVYGIESMRVDQRRDGRPVYQDTVYPLRICKRELEDHRDLLYVTADGNNHYAYIRDLSRLVRPQLTARHGRIHLCKRCFAYFDDRPNKLGLTGEQRLEEHRRYCYATAPVRMDMSQKTEIRFKRHEFTRRERFVIYADFECALRPAADVPDAEAPRGAAATRVHVPYAFAYQIVDALGREDFPPRVYFGEDASREFMERLRHDVEHLWDILYNDRILLPRLTPEDEALFRAADRCYLCHGRFTRRDPKVRDHNHAPPNYEYRGVAHRSCNIRYRKQRQINCYFHNLSNYDAHFIVRELAVDRGDIGVLAHTEERYIGFTKRFEYRHPAVQQRGGRTPGFTVRFLDSYRFLSSSLAGLAAALPADRMFETRKQFPDDRLFELVRRKGVFPYSHVTSYDTLYTTRELPPKDAFYNDLTLENVSDADYEHARNVWREFGCRNLRDYADTYLRCDVALLTEVFEEFRNTSMREYELDPAHYYTLPSYAWDVMLRTCGVELDTLQDFDMYLFIEQGIRGGISQTITRYAKANHDHCRQEDRRPDEPNRHLLYVDANNLYGWAMSQCLPTGRFQWLTRQEIDYLDIGELDPEGTWGYILEVDLHYPAHLHDAHRDLPYCCETKRTPTGRFKKLVTTLDDKPHYICHYRILQQALENGLELRAVHRAVKFRQSRWLERYILKNTELRKKARTKFEQDFFKLMNNAVFGKTIENVRKRLNVRLVCTPERFTKYVAKSSFLDRTYYTDDVALLRMAKIRIVLDKPIYVGMCVLELSKWLMYDFLRRMKDRYGDRLRVDYMDTDSFFLDILTDDVYRDMLGYLDDLDTSSYPRDHPCYSPANAKVIGKFKDEANGRALLEYLGLRSKLYFMDIADDDEIEDGPPHLVKTVKRAKGVAKGVVKHVLGPEDYRDCLFNGVVKRTINPRFQSHLHRVFTVQVTKLSLSPADDKRYVLPDGIHTLPWGHKDIPPLPQQQQQEPSDDEDEDDEL